MAKIRVLHVSNRLELGGTEKTLQIFCQYLDKSRFEVFACGRMGGGVRVEALERYGIPVFIEPPDLTQLVRDYHIDICHVHRAGTYEPGSLPARRPGGPRVVETNVFHALDEQEGDRIDCHCFVSESSRSTYFRRYGAQPGKRYEVLYNPVDFLEVGGGEKSFSRTIGRCSRPDDQKWHDVCLKSLPRIFRNVPEVRCLLQGATERVRSTLTGLGLQGRVEFLEPSMYVKDFYRRLDIFTHGSRIGETFGCVIAEAMANGIPVVTLSTPQRKKANAQAELVEHNVTGFVCRWQWQYAGAVIELLQNEALRAAFGRRSYEKAREQFDAALLTKRLEDIYVDLMDMRP
ncbi:MAG: glycosyltransferase family 4 protein [Nitrospira sp.]|jgi:glycosyltransferase involved in cell wall biosynthesis|nr:glycosyltransferase family 4 protein [Nitrospira sp.]MBP6604903.1 glycosyltransferase family 4 protein [Nitrospira sp.]MCI1279401.1 glycosyltransferase family 4 protein [Nitrospira sp.]HQY58636.1 glycosyltransferase family 4 protein [Nitrospira sp.]HRA98720.1 glycosyltransferase family 4 protein [Nitrospira sp.]